MSPYLIKRSEDDCIVQIFQIMEDFFLPPCQAGPDVRTIKVMREYEMGYYEYVLIYVDDILIVSGSPEKVMEML